MTIIIAPVQAVLWTRTQSDFRKELQKRSEAKFNAAPTVNRVLLSFRISTSLFRVMIGVIFRSALHPMRAFCKATAMAFPESPSRVDKLAAFALTQ